MVIKILNFRTWQFLLNKTLLYDILAGYLALLGFPIMHPFHAICTNFIIAITSLPPSHPSLPTFRPSLQFWPLNPHQLCRGGVGVKKLSICLGSSWNFPHFWNFDPYASDECIRNSRGKEGGGEQTKTKMDGYNTQETWKNCSSS